ncbi:MAG: hypothetical protein QOI95_76 [Acidimicrobiaceae bacterium]
MQLRTLIVDDHPDTLVECKAAFSLDPRLVLDCTSSKDDALAALVEHVYDLIIVDLQLDDARPMVLEGEQVLAYAARRHPIAELYAWTSYPSLGTTTALVVQRLLSPDEPIASRLCGLIDKTKFVASDKALTIAQKVAESRLSNPVVLEPAKLAVVVDKLSQSHSVFGWTEPEEIGLTARTEEIEFLVARLFGQGTRAGTQSLERTVEIDLFDELAAQGDEASTGSSGAAVFLARPRGPEGVLGEWVVVKVGGLDHVSNEVARYERYVRYDRAAKHRVELLGSAPGNNVGAIAYSLAGPDPQHSQTIAAPIRKADTRALRVIGTLFSDEWKHWHGIKLDAGNPMNFFQREFEFGFNDRLDQFLDGVRSAVTWRAKQQAAAGAAWWVTDEDRSLRTADGTELALAGQGLNNSLITHVPFAICHGDSHAANIICTEDDSPRLIDYAATGPGPRALDFAVFEASHRVIEADSLDIDSCLRRHSAEQDLWSTVWAQKTLTDSDAKKIVDSRSTFWEQLSATVLTRLRLSFPDCTPEEYARVAILQGVRLAPIWWVDDSKSGAKRRKNCVRIRLSSWMSPMVSLLRA